MEGEPKVMFCGAEMEHGRGRDESGNEIIGHFDRVAGLPDPVEFRFANGRTTRLVWLRRQAVFNPWVACRLAIVRHIVACLDRRLLAATPATCRMWVLGPLDADMPGCLGWNRERSLGEPSHAIKLPKTRALRHEHRQGDQDGQQPNHEPASHRQTDIRPTQFTPDTPGTSTRPVRVTNGHRPLRGTNSVFAFPPASPG